MSASIGASPGTARLHGWENVARVGWARVRRRAAARPKARLRVGVIATCDEDDDHESGEDDEPMHARPAWESQHRTREGSFDRPSRSPTVVFATGCPRCYRSPGIFIPVFL